MLLYKKLLIMTFGTSLVGPNEFPQLVSEQYINGKSNKGAIIFK
jgi:hypothetical protein